MSSFYCQRRIEGDSACQIQCGHCEEYYEPLVVEGWEESWEAFNKNLPVDKRSYRLGWFDGRGMGKRDCIAFAKWASNLCWMYKIHEDRWYNFCEIPELTTEQLFELFLRSKYYEI